MENETAWLLEHDGLALGVADTDDGVHWMPFTLPSVLRFVRREDALRFQRLMVRVRKKLRVCPLDVEDASAIEHMWLAESREEHDAKG